MIAVVVPVYNEAENVNPFVRSLRRVLKDASILFVDDGSPDGTGEVIRKIARTDRRVALFERMGKRGRGSAVWDGMRRVLKQQSFDLLLEMDVDGSHDPADIPRLIRASKHADIVIGSRNLLQSRVPIPRLRRLFSILSNWLTRLLLRVPITDYTNGFRVYRRPVVEYLARFPLTSTGYFALSETAVRAYLAGFQMTDVPITFVDRKRGMSKLTMKEVFGAFVQLVQLARAKSQYPKTRG